MFVTRDLRAHVGLRVQSLHSVLSARSLPVFPLCFLWFQVTPELELSRVTLSFTSARCPLKGASTSHSELPVTCQPLSDGDQRRPSLGLQPAGKVARPVGSGEEGRVSGGHGPVSAAA